MCAWGVGTEWNEQGKLKPHHTWLTFWNHYSYQTFASGFLSYWSSGVSFLITMSCLPYQYSIHKRQTGWHFGVFFVFFFLEWLVCIKCNFLFGWFVAVLCVHVRTLSRWSLPPELRVQIRKCLVKRKHCLSPSFLSEREPSRTLLSFPLSTEGNWIKEPERKTARKRNEKCEKEWQVKLSQQSHSSIPEQMINESKTLLLLNKRLQEEKGKHGRFSIRTWSEKKSKDSDLISHSPGNPYCHFSLVYS